MYAAELTRLDRRADTAGLMEDGNLDQGLGGETVSLQVAGVSRSEAFLFQAKSLARMGVTTFLYGLESPLAERPWD